MPKIPCKTEDDEFPAPPMKARRTQNWFGEADACRHRNAEAKARFRARRDGTATACPLKAFYQLGLYLPVPLRPPFFRHVRVGRVPFDRVRLLHDAPAAGEAQVHARLQGVVEIEAGEKVRKTGRQA